MLLIGVDVAKQTLEVARWHEGQGVRLGTFPNALAGWQALERALGLPEAGTPEAGTPPPADAPAPEPAAPAGGPPRVALVLEPTGGYELAFAEWARAQGWRVHRPNPAHVRAWAKSEGLRAKTDRQDARLLAHFLAKHPTLPVWQPLAQAVGELEQLLHQRDEVADLLQRERTRQQQLSARPGTPAAVRASLERLVQTLATELAQLEQAMADHVQQQAEVRDGRQRLLSVPGIGPRTVLPVLVTLARFHTLTAGQGTAKGLVAYTGLDPQPYSSGTSVWQPALISRQGDRRLRSRLYMGALGALRGHNPLCTFYQRLVARGKVKKVALVAAARKLLVWAWAVYTSGQVFDATKFVHDSA